MVKKTKILIEFLIGILIAFGIFSYLYIIDFIPIGNDIYGHLYKGQILTKNIQNGIWYPLYTTEWYNGIQLFRYWPIFTYYVISFFNIFVNDITISYYIFLAFTFLLSYSGWCAISNKENKWIYVVIGIFYWFLPDNIRVTFGEGNLARVFIFALLPFFFYFFSNLLERKKHFIPTVLMIVLLTCSHFMLAAMCAIIFCIYAIFSSRKNWYYGILSFICGFLVSGLILYPGLKGGLVSDTNSASIETMKDWSQSLFTSLSVTNRYETICTFGISVLIISIFILKYGKNKVGTMIGLIFFTLTSSIFTPLLMQLPLSQVWWMARFIQMCYVLIFYELGKIIINKKYLIIIFILLILDIIPSYKYFTKVDEFNVNTYLLEDAIEVTNNRLGVVDESTIGPYISYYVLEKNIPYLQGWAIQGATTKDNIISLTESMKLGFYNYSFKNLLELGCDSIIVKKSILFNFDKNEFINSASYYGYELLKENNEVYLFDNKQINETFGVNFTYNNLSIGNSSVYISYLYPSFEQGFSDNIFDYQLEDLLKYKKIYLSNFQFNRTKELEELLLTLSNNGVQIYVDTTHLPINALSISNLFDIESKFIDLREIKNISFNENKYMFDVPYSWYTTYLTTSNPNVNLHTYKYGEIEIGYLADYENIHLIGFNLPYLYIESPQDDLHLLLNDIFDTTRQDYLVDYEIVNINIKYDSNSILIESPIEINTTLAYQDNFKSNELLKENNNLLIVQEGITNINIIYKHFVEGIIITILGLILTIITYFKIIVIDTKIMEDIE